MILGSPANFYNFNPDTIATYIMQKDWKGCWKYVRQLIESFSIKLDQSHLITIQKVFQKKISVNMPNNLVA